ncbi:MAG: protein SanA [Rickettsiales bacterium]|nr:protein SanA [Rickettsiales bacterium]
MLALFILFLPFILVIYSNHLIENASHDKTYLESEKIPYNKVGLVLGTSKYLQNGNINLYFRYRIDATVALYKQDKIEYVLVSGDNGNKDYDEPTDFKNELIKKGIPEDKIYLDYAGFRTLDSVVRAKEIFGQTQLTIISQRFHNERAIYLAEKFGINAIGFNAQDVNYQYGFKTRTREYFARTKAVFDILFGIDPKFLGKKIEVR